MCSARKGRKEWPAKPRCNVHPCFRRGSPRFRGGDVIPAKAGIGPAPAGLWRASVQQRERLQERPRLIRPAFEQTTFIQENTLSQRSFVFGRETGQESNC
jgi:hypothetical protein